MRSRVFMKAEQLPSTSFSDVDPDDIVTGGQNYIDLNAQINLYSPDGTLQLEKDKEAARAYFRQHVNPNTVFFHDLEEKIEFLTENGYYDKSVFDMYDWEFVKDMYKLAYSYKYRFKSFVGAYKFYNQYAMKTSDGKRYLERYEDRVTLNGLVLADGDENKAASVIKSIMENRYQPATPTFLNAGRIQAGEKVSCFLLQVQDSMDSITKVVSASLQLSKMGGGVGINLSNLREAGASIKGIENAASGVVPVMKLLEDSFSYANQLGARNGAGAVYLHLCHKDILSFLDTKKENADEKVRIKTLSLGVIVPDIAFELARNNEDMYLFSPQDVEKVYGKPFTEISISEHYHDMVENPSIRKSKVSARKLFQEIAAIQYESGYPYMVFEDTANRWNNIDGRVSMSNLCVSGDTEVLTDKGYRKVKDLYDSQEDFNVVVDERARTMDLDNIGTSIQKSTKMFKTSEDAEVFKVTTLEGREISATAWHKMYVERNGDIVKIPLLDLEIGDKILVNSDSISSRGEFHNPDLAYVAGVVAADGTGYALRGNNYGAKISLYGDKDEVIDDITSAIHNSLQGRDDLVERQATLSPEFVWSGSSSRHSISSAPLYKLFKEHGYDIKEKKVQVPDFIKQSDEDTQIAFLNGIFQMDGTITGSKKYNSISIELGSVHQDFLLDVQKLLGTFGISSRIYASKKEDSFVMMPDGHGGEKEYLQKKSWSLRVSSMQEATKLHDLLSWRSVHNNRWNELTGDRVKENYNIKRNKFAIVKSIEFVGNEDVYDVTVENGHSLIFNGIVTGNCSEILQVQQPSQFDPVTGEYSEIGTDISCNLGSLNVANSMRKGKLEESVHTAINALTTVTLNTSIDRVPTVKNGNDKYHSIGLGAMSLASFLASEKIMYGSDESLDFANVFFAVMRYHALQASSDIAQERGETFFEFDKSDYKRKEGETTSKALKNYTQGIWETFPHTERIQKMFEEYEQWFPTQEDWQKLDDKIQETGLFHSYLMATAPTGSISYVTNSSASIHPVTSLIEVRKEGKMGRVYYPSPDMNDDNKEYYQDAYEVGYKPLINMYATISKHVDQGCSLTLFFKSDTTTRDLNRAYIYAWSRGHETNENGLNVLEDPTTSWKSGYIKTLYYSRIRQSSLEGTQVDCVSCTI